MIEINPKETIKRSIRYSAIKEILCYDNGEAGIILIAGPNELYTLDLEDKYDDLIADIVYFTTFYSLPSLKDRMEAKKDYLENRWKLNQWQANLTNKEQPENNQ